MHQFELVTPINAPIERCFDLARSIDLHKISTKETKEEAIAGTTSGLISKGESVTWRAVHFGVNQTLSVLITEMTPPSYFRDVMVKGAFKSFQHDHFFDKLDEATIMKDIFSFEAPFGIAGHVFSKLILTDYMRNLLLERNRVIKMFAETDLWKKVIFENVTE